MQIAMGFYLPHYPKTGFYTLKFMSRSCLYPQLQLFQDVSKRQTFWVVCTRMAHLDYLELIGGCHKKPYYQTLYRVVQML